MSAMTPTDAHAALRARLRDKTGYHLTLRLSIVADWVVGAGNSSGAADIRQAIDTLREIEAAWDAQTARADRLSNLEHRDGCGCERCQMASGIREQLIREKLAEAEARADRLERERDEALADGPDGAWICETCGFVALKMLLRATDGAVGIDSCEVQDVCPNDGTSLRRKTWKEDAIDSDRVGREQMQRASEAEAKVEALTAERDMWNSTARDMANNCDFWRGLVLQIGEMFGVEARTADDGSVMEDVLALKGPELVASLRAERDQRTAEIAGMLKAEIASVRDLLAKVLREAAPAFELRDALSKAASVPRHGEG